MKALLVHNPGAFSSIQDAGRPGLRRFGIPTSGAMDQFSYRVANLLVGNAPDTAGLRDQLGACGIEVRTYTPPQTG